MGAAKHTPGNWQAGLPADGGRINVYSDDSMAMRICRVDSDANFGNHSAANARLIAAAPLLLEALTDALDSLEYVAKVAPELSGYGVRSDVIRAGRRAIAAAKGEA